MSRNTLPNLQTKVNTQRQFSSTDENISFDSYGNAAEKHDILKKSIQHHKLDIAIVRLLEELVNHSNRMGVSRISQATLSKLLGKTPRTIRNYLDITDDLGLTHRSKNGWKESNTTTVLAIFNAYDYELINKGEEITDDLMNINPTLTKGDLNTIHYVEYECSLNNLYENPESKTVETTELSKNEDNDAQEAKGVILSEWEASKKTLESELVEAVKSYIPDRFHDDVVKTIKRIKASVEAKLKLIQEIGQCAKQFVINNVCGLIVSRFKKMKGSFKKVVKPRDYNNENKIREKARELAEKELEVLGISDPRNEGCTFDEAEEFDEIVGKLYIKHYKILSSQESAKDETPIPQGWADRAYS